MLIVDFIIVPGDRGGTDDLFSTTTDTNGGSSGV